MQDARISKEEFEKGREEAIKQIVELLNKYGLTIITEHSIKIVPREDSKKGE
jgi:hypothetical protein